MALVLPEWYKGSQFHNVEDLFHDYLQPLLPEVRVVHWLEPGWYVPKGFENATNGTEPTLRLWRQPGQRNYETNEDVPLLQVAAVTRSHDESWELLEFVDSMMRVLDQGHKIEFQDKRVSVNSVGLWLGPQIIPEAPVDEFFIPMTWRFTIHGLKLQPNYREILNTL